VANVRGSRAKESKGLHHIRRPASIHPIRRATTLVVALSRRVRGDALSLDRVRKSTHAAENAVAVISKGEAYSAVTVKATTEHNARDDPFSQARRFVRWARSRQRSDPGRAKPTAR
jgi:hypothetical protein